MAEKRHRTPPAKERPAYAITSVDNALRLAAALQLEGTMTVSAAAERLEVAPSTAHRLLTMLVYRDFATQEPDHSYRPGPVLQMGMKSRSTTALLRTIVLPHLEDLASELDETVNVAIRVGDQARFIASVEGTQSLRVSSREGMVLPAHRTSSGLLLLTALDPAELEALYSPQRFSDRPGAQPDMIALRRDIEAARRTGVVLNKERSEVGIVAVGVPIRNPGAGGGRPGRLGAGASLPRLRPGPLPRQPDHHRAGHRGRHRAGRPSGLATHPSGSNASPGPRTQLEDVMRWWSSCGVHDGRMRTLTGTRCGVPPGVRRPPRACRSCPGVDAACRWANPD